MVNNFDEKDDQFDRSRIRGRPNLMNRILKIIKEDKTTRSIIIFVLKIISLINSCIPKKEKRIVFYENDHPQLLDNSQALFDYLITHEYSKEYDIICFLPYCTDRKLYQDSKVKVVGIIKGVLYYCTSKYVFFSNADLRIVPSSKQMVIQMYHGTPLKKALKMKKDDFVYVEKVDNFTFALSTSEFCRPIWAEIFGCSVKKILIEGHARNDYLFGENEVISKCGINRSEFKKIVLWMPTFRESVRERLNDDTLKDNETKLPGITTFEQLDFLNSYLKNRNVYICIKAHPIAKFVKIEYSNIKLITNEDLEEKGIKLYEFVKDFDALITDYSSIFYDFLLLDRPIAFVIDDIDLYKSKKGFVFENPLEFMPGEKIYNGLIGIEEFINGLLAERDEFSEERKKINNLVNHYQYGGFRKHLLDSIGIYKRPEVL